jgi:signal transduction histidine kinase
MRDETSIPAAGLGLRTKLVLGFIGLLAILIAVGVTSISLLSDLGGSIDVILRENYKSVIACDRMKEALERLDSAALFALAGELGQGSALAAENRPRFEAALQTELGNITEPGEGAKAALLRQLYAAYTPVLARILAPETPAGARHALYFSRLLPVFRQIKGTAGEILDLNERNMVEANDRARRLAAEAGRSMALLLLAGTAFAGLCIFFLSRAILGPLERLTGAARRIEGGDLGSTVPVASRDEMGQLAAAFNSMAAGLRELRESDQAHLLRARRFSQLAIDSLPEAVVVLGTDRKVLLANREAARLLEVQADQAVPERHGSWLTALVDRAEGGRVQERLPEAGIELPPVARERFFLPRIEPLRDAQGRPEGFLLVMEDVTGRRRGSEVHTGLLANAAQDLEKWLAPLRKILESLGAERSGALTPEQRRLVDGAREEAERLTGVAQGLLAMSRLEEIRRQLDTAPIAPADLIAAAVGKVADGPREKGVELVTKIDPAPQRVLADPARTGQVVFSLLQNALAHTPAGGSVTIRADAEPGRTRFAVADTGSGIPAAFCDRLFEPFYQVPGTEDLGGVGLGLANARDIVQAHGGEIHCESQEGRGTTVWFTLPAATP